MTLRYVLRQNKSFLIAKELTAPTAHSTLCLTPSLTEMMLCAYQANQKKTYKKL